MAGRSMPWIRLYGEMLHDPKITYLSGLERWIWVGLLLLANESKPRGAIHICETTPYTIPTLGDMLRLDIDEMEYLEPALKKMAQLNMISIDDAGFIKIVHFDERQYKYPSNLPERVKERVTRHRELKSEECNENVTIMKQERNGTDTDTDTETDNSSTSTEQAKTEREKTIAAYEYAYVPHLPGKEAPISLYPTDAILDDIEYMADVWGDDVLQEAIKQLKKPSLPPKYLQRIIARWKKEGKVEPKVTPRERDVLREKWGV